MINKVVYIGYQPLSEKVIEDFYFENLIDKGVFVEYWDLSEIYFNGIFDSHFKNDCIVKINTFSALKGKIDEQDKLSTMFLTNITFEYRVLVLYKLLSAGNCKTSFFARGALPIPKAYSNTWSIILKLQRDLNLDLLLRFIKNRYAFFLKKVGIVKPHLFVFQAGKKGIQTIGVGHDIENVKSRIINVNSFDYDKYVKTKKNSEKLVKNKYCVFLDEYLPFHPDFEMLNIKTIEANEYYYVLNRFFDLLENKFNIEVVISAHPKAENYFDKNYFNNRKVFFNKSAELTRNAEFVIAHCSTSISFAVLNKKSILTLTSNAIKEVMPNYFNFIVHFSKTLDSILINIDCVESTEIILREPDPDRYLEYTYNYLTSLKSEELVSAEVFTESILSL